ncbi:lysosomal amino acid transporter 1 homolog isoform X1 [Petromyzon marinus]|uniref:lysosomal amino acid transporter 1 homolog isoform X1 n=1 Tax=Petromyzon marinus TaxID=7757 RepID=UPI003F707CD4
MAGGGEVPGRAWYPDSGVSWWAAASAAALGTAGPNASECHLAQALKVVCANGSIAWISTVFGECASNGRDVASVALGLLSLLCFLFASVPQLYESYRTGRADEALSIWFLLCWLLGDTSNLIGCFLANQLSLQKYTAIYYVCMDMVMILQYLYYKRRNQGPTSLSVNAMGVACILGGTGLVGLLGRSPSQALATGRLGRSLLSSKSYVDPAIVIGYTSGSISCLFYLGSRLPQIHKNYKRHSTQGVSYMLFALTVLGNLTYGLSVLLKNPDEGDTQGCYFLRHLPWLVGSLGTLGLDTCITIQFIKYRKPQHGTRHDEREPLIG